MLVKYIKVHGRLYKMQHPGARAYMAASKNLRSVTSDGYIYWDNEKLFDFAFGRSPRDSRIVFGEDDGWINWTEAGIEPNGDTPSIAELEEVWSPVLARFLSGEFIVDETRPPRFEWVSDDNAGNTRGDKGDTSRK